MVALRVFLSFLLKEKNYVTRVILFCIFIQHFSGHTKYTVRNQGTCYNQEGIASPVFFNKGFYFSGLFLQYLQVQYLQVYIKYVVPTIIYVN